MKRILYIGNALSAHGNNLTSIETLSKKLETNFQVTISSNKKNKILRLVDMMLAVILRARKTDVVLIDTYSTKNFYYALIISQLSRLFKIPYIPFLKGGNLEKRLLYSPRSSSWLFNNAHHILAPSLFLIEKFKKYGYNDLLYVPNSIDLKKYPFNRNQEDAIKLLWVRSFSEIYNPLMAIDILRILRDSGQNAQLCMVGPDKDGSMKKAKKYADKLELKVKFTGKLSKDEWIKLSKAYNMFINTTNVDNTPVSVIEAMALGLPIVSTNVGGMPYLINNEKEGILVEPKNPKLMAEAIIKLHSNQEFTHTLTSNARKKVEQFDWDIVKYKWLEILN